ncbi:hypothetical protein MCAP1_001477 [Malassezia caprae]|uniref:Uncharacterized protein n=1 Tax=Malassezia caprae TaxID=1381934 RepID=A0AAF0IUY6_9BASI|nr:hypothetical protein MCAP1_001477 [Malassezia caprae]
MSLKRAYYVALAPHLYHTIVLTRPSQLDKLVRTLTTRPALGELVHSLSIGTGSPARHLPFPRPFRDLVEALDLTDELHQDSHADPTTAAGSLLSATLERDIAEVATLYAGPAGATGIDVRHYGRDSHGRTIGLTAWTLRWLDARGLLRWMRSLAAYERDEELRRWHTTPYHVEAHTYTLRAESPHAAVRIAEYEHGDAPIDDPFAPQPRHLRPVGARYDPLDWADASDMLFALPASDDDTLVALVWRVLQSMPPSSLPRWLCVLIAKALAQGRWRAMSAILAHAKHTLPTTPASPPSALPFLVPDRFEDLGLYARADALALVLPGAPDTDLMEDLPSLRARKQTLAQSMDRCPFGVPLHRLVVPPTAPAPVSPPPTIHSLAASVGALLAFTPYLHTLCLRGSLDQVLASPRWPAALWHLHTLCLGPPPRFSIAPLSWYMPAHSASQALCHMELSMYMLTQKEALAIGGADGALPHLVSVRWALASSAAGEIPLAPGLGGVAAAIATMLGLDVPGVVPAPPPEQARRGVRHLHVVLGAPFCARIVAALPEHVAHDPRLHLESTGTCMERAPLTKRESSGPVCPWPLGLGAAAVPASWPVDGFEAVAVIWVPDDLALSLPEGAALDVTVGDALWETSELESPCVS